MWSTYAPLSYLNLRQTILTNVSNEKQGEQPYNTEKFLQNNKIYHSAASWTTESTREWYLITNDIYDNPYLYCAVT